MKNTNKIFTFITVVTLAVSTLAVNASEISKTRSSNYLLPENKVEFASFMNARAKFFLLRNDAAWDTFNNVVSSFNNNPLVFMEMSSVEKHDFLKAANAIQLKLDKMIGPKAEEWKIAVRQSTGIYKFSWEAGVDEQDLIDVISIVVPLAPQKAVVSGKVVNRFNWGTELNESNLIDVESIIVPELSL